MLAPQNQRRKVCVALDLDETVFVKNDVDAKQAWYVSRDFWIKQISELKTELGKQSIDLELAIVTAKDRYDDLCAEAHGALNQFMVGKLISSTNPTTRQEHQGHLFQLNDTLLGTCGNQDIPIPPEFTKNHSLATSFHIVKNPLVYDNEKLLSGNIKDRLNLVNSLILRLKPYRTSLTQNHILEIKKATNILQDSLKDTQQTISLNHFIPFFEIINLIRIERRVAISAVKKQQCLRTLKTKFGYGNIILIDDREANIKKAQEGGFGGILADWKNIDPTPSNQNRIKSDIQDAFKQAFNYLSEAPQKNSSPTCITEDTTTSVSTKQTKLLVSPAPSIFTQNTTAKKEGAPCVKGSGAAETIPNLNAQRDLATSINQQKGI